MLVIRILKLQRYKFLTKNGLKTGQIIRCNPFAIVSENYLPSRTILHGSGILSSKPFLSVILSGSIALLKRPSYRSSQVGFIPANIRRFEDV